MRLALKAALVGFAVAMTIACSQSRVNVATTGRQDSSGISLQKPQKSAGSSSEKKLDRVSAKDRGNDEAFADLTVKAEGAKVKQRFEGQASYYSNRLSGNTMAGGQPYDPNLPTAAHRTLPFGALVRVVRIDGGQSVVVKIADRGPFGNKRRIIDLSRSAAARLGILRAGVAEVRVEVLALPLSTP
jgi:rare lipoprotein A (peptidoglycan hydrolase)